MLTVTRHVPFVGVAKIRTPKNDMSNRQWRHVHSAVALLMLMTHARSRPRRLAGGAAAAALRNDLARVTDNVACLCVSLTKAMKLHCSAIMMHACMHISSGSWLPSSATTRCKTWSKTLSTTRYSSRRWRTHFTTNRARLKRRIVQVLSTSLSIHYAATDVLLCVYVHLQYQWNPDACDLEHLAPSATNACAQR